MTDTLKELPESERPYEKCEEYGASFLSDAELLAVILRNGTRDMNSLDLAHEILKNAGPDMSLSGIENMADSELLSIPGIGRVKLIVIRCLTEFSKRLWKARVRNGLNFNNPKKCAAFFMEDMRHLSHEEVRAVLLDTKANYICSHVLTKGLSDRSLISPRELFSYALKHDASQVILLHNHPSGDPTPSREDLAVTRQMIVAGCMINVALADSIIIGDGIYVSMRELLKNEFL
ncbi:MAG: DNA repair protein RadC [Lachnospiraceae bacterium]|nr:DNA repair protein RadC [Lachnospiraceae bacterium]